MAQRKVEDSVSGDANHLNNDNCDGDDEKKIFLSRIPQSFDEESVLRIFQGKFGENSVEGVFLLYERDEKKSGDIGGRHINDTHELSGNLQGGDEGNEEKGTEDKTHLPHRGFGFVTFDTQKTRDVAISTKTVRGSAKPTSKRKHTMYIRPVVRDGYNEGGLNVDSSSGQNEAVGKKKNACHLWSMRRCPYGDECKFLHEGDGACLPSNDNDHDDKGKRKRQKCFSFKKKGKCKLGGKCSFSHDIQPKTKLADGQNKDGSDEIKKVAEKKDGASGRGNDNSNRDCINWKTKGKCRKKDRGCPYRHSKDVQHAALTKIDSKKKKRARNDEEGKEGSDQKKKGKDKKRQPLSVRVFGLNYNTTEDDVRSYFEHCGPIVELTFPTFDDSGRSKGYCGILFQSPKAVEQAILLDGQELHGRWLSVQQGKMYLRQWEEHHQTSSGRGENENPADMPSAGEFGQRVKRRKRHGFKE